MPLVALCGNGALDVLLLHVAFSVAIHTAIPRLLTLSPHGFISRHTSAALRYRVLRHFFAGLLFRGQSVRIGAIGIRFSPPYCIPFQQQGYQDCLVWSH